jgi:hypothetical protein
MNDLYRGIYLVMLHQAEVDRDIPELQKWVRVLAVIVRNTNQIDDFLTTWSAK